MGQDVAHEVHLAALPGSTKKTLVDGGPEPLVGIRDHQPDLLQATPLELLEQFGIGGLRFVVHGLYGQDTHFSVQIHRPHHHDGDTDDLPIVPDLLVEGIHPDDRVLLLQGAVAKLLDLEVQF